MKSKFLLLFLSLFMVVGGVKAQDLELPVWNWQGEDLVANNTFYLVNSEGNGNDTKGRWAKANGTETSYDAKDAALWTFSDTNSTTIKNGNTNIGGSSQTWSVSYSMKNSAKAYRFTYQTGNWIKLTHTLYVSNSQIKVSNGITDNPNNTGDWYLVSPTQRGSYDTFKKNLEDAQELLNGNTLTDDQKDILRESIKAMGSTVNYKSDKLTSFNNVVGFAKEGKALSSVSRTAVAGKYGTICLPYDFTASGATIWEVTDVTNGIVGLSLVASPKAGVPYMYLATANAQTFTMSTNANVVDAPIANKFLTGTFETTDVPTGNFLLQTQNGHQAFYTVNSTGLKCGAYKCYMNKDTNTNNPVKGIFFSEEDMATAVEAIEVLNSGKAQIFDMSGHKLGRLQKGINIVNGKKIMVK